MTFVARQRPPNPKDVSGFGHNAPVVPTAFTLGPTIASAILAVGSAALFAINIPFGVVAMLIGLKTLPRTPTTTHVFDFSGALRAAAGLGLLSWGSEARRIMRELAWY